jgi:hypothetical protein
VPRDSGRVTANLRRPKRYNRKLRRAFYMAALSSLKVNGSSRTFYDKKRGERLIHTQALLALARRLVDVLWALLRDGRGSHRPRHNPLPQRLDTIIQIPPSDDGRVAVVAVSRTASEPALRLPVPLLL